MNISYVTNDSPTQEWLNAVDGILDEFNIANGAIKEVRRLCVFAHNGEGVVIGGAVGRTWGQCCELQQLAVDADQRARGIGVNLMSKFEAEARARGCTLVYLDTFSFQAPDFYRRCGYQVAHEIKGFSSGVIKYTMHKLVSPV